MKYIFWGLLGLIVLVVVTVIGFRGVNTDLADPEVAARFLTKMETNCVEKAKELLARSDTILKAQEEFALKQTCACTMKEVTHILAAKGAKTPEAAQQIYFDNKQKITEAFLSCGQASGF